MRTRSKTLFCPLCGTNMKKNRVQRNAHRREKNGQILNVVRVFYVCPNLDCLSVANFDYRTDGAVGDLYKQLQLEKVTGKKLVTDLMHG